MPIRTNELLTLRITTVHGDNFIGRAWNFSDEVVTLRGYLVTEAGWQSNECSYILPVANIRYAERGTFEYGGALERNLPECELALIPA